MTFIKSLSFFSLLRQDGLVASMSTCHAVGCGFVPRSGHTKDHHKKGTNCLPAWHASVMLV